MLKCLQVFFTITLTRAQSGQTSRTRALWAAGTCQLHSNKALQRSMRWLEIAAQKQGCDQGSTRAMGTCTQIQAGKSCPTMSKSSTSHRFC